MFSRSKLILVCLFVSPFLFALNKVKIVERPVGFGRHIVHKTRRIDVVVVHSVFNASSGDKYDLSSILHQFSRYRVSSHYIIDRLGNVFRLVNEKDIAYHAGNSQLPDGRRSVNSCSIGIELINDSVDQPSLAQINSLSGLVADICARYKIKYVLRHSDIAPGRKTDPWNLNWEDFLKRIQK